MKQRKLSKAIYKTTYKMVELEDYPDLAEDDWTVLETFEYINEHNEGLNLTEKERKAISSKYKRKKINSLIDFVNIYCECCGWKLLTMSARGNYDYLLTFYKEVK